MNGANEHAIETKVPFAQEVWETLSGVDVSPYVEEKGGLSYISWANCFTLLMGEYPESTHSFEDHLVLPNGTATVACRVTVRSGDNKSVRGIALPVMDYKNKAITDPNSRDYNDSMMRCFVKACALHGLGIDLYRKELGVSEVEAVEMITEKQLLTLQDFAEADQIPAEALAWCEKRKWAMTHEDAARLIETINKAQSNASA